MVTKSDIRHVENGVPSPEKDIIVYVDPKTIGKWPFKIPNLPQTKEAMDGLRLSIKKHGIREAIRTWGNSGMAKNPVIAGETRLSIALELGFGVVPVIVMEFDSFEEAEIYANEDNLLRREIPPIVRLQKAHELMELYSTASDKKEHAAQGMHTRTRAAMAAQVAPSTLGEYDYIMRHATDEMKAKVAAETISVHKAFVETQNAVKEKTGAVVTSARIGKVLDDLKTLSAVLRGLPDLTTRVKAAMKSIAGAKTAARKAVHKKFENAAETIASANHGELLAGLYVELLDNDSAEDLKGVESPKER